MTRTARCPACGGAAWVPALRLPASAILRCAGCGLGPTEPPPAEADDVGANIGYLVTAADARWDGLVPSQHNNLLLVARRPA